MEPNANTEPAPPPVPSSPDYAFERDRATHRRDAMRIQRPEAHANTQWGLALSGGGIRSATFSLGAMQGMEKTFAPVPSTSSTTTAPVATSMLRQFDYLSTVSGGGYIGGFFSSLFVPGRLDRPAPPVQSGGAAVASAALSDKQVADQAYRVFTEEPPTRLRTETTYDPQRPGLAALAWLRENGRYLIPSGAGDLAYAVAVHIRNWCGAHYVLGTVCFGLFAFLAMLRSLAAHAGLPGVGETGFLAVFAEHERDAIVGVLLTVDMPLDLNSIWWSPWWWLLLPTIALWILPAGLAFWLTHPDESDDAVGGARTWSIAATVCVGIGILMLSLAYFIDRQHPFWQPIAYLLAAEGLLATFGPVWYVLTAAFNETVTRRRVVLTRRLSTGMICAALIGAVALIDTIAQTLYVQGANIWQSLSPAIVAAVLIWFARQLSSMGSERKAPPWLAKIPLRKLAAIAGTILALLVAVMWAQAMLWIAWNGLWPDPDAFASRDAHLPYLLIVLLAVGLNLVITLAAGRFPGFLNLSTLQGIYTARITRAYLGASNSLRFLAGQEHLRSVTEPAPGDLMEIADLYRNAYAPMHIINTCMNLTSDPTEQLVQSDRKGKPLAVIPGGLAYDKETFPMPQPDARTETGAALTVGEWIGVSGAAFTTGLGRGTSLSYSLLLGLANVRLGRWWGSQIRASSLKVRDTGLRAAFKTQIYLIDELLARFHGTRRAWQYLSDGGHFENTAAYELLRPERKIKLIVICDCGADPKYEFGDLANLTRLARIDFGIELEVDGAVTNDVNLGSVFGKTTDFFRGKDGVLPSHDKCAVLVNVYHDARLSNIEVGERRKDPDARIIILKPRLLTSSAADLCEYRATHPAFPQEPTADQFFDEAQWESYRRLGMEVAMRVFPGRDSSPAYRAAFFEKILA